MRTRFTDAQLADPAIAACETNLRKCVHCGFCTATCPTYVLLGDELDGPRGRIALIQAMLETGGPPAPETVKHVDRCLSCLACKTTCPSGVDYGQLIDQAREHIETHHRRPATERWLRGLVAAVLTRPWLFRASARLAAAFAWAAPLAPGRLEGLMRMAPRRLSPFAETDRPGVFPAVGERRMRVALLGGCVQPSLAPEINAAAVRLLTRLGAEVVITGADGCCGSLPLHMGKADRAKALAARQVAGWVAEMDDAGLDAIVATVSGCGTTLKDYGRLFADDPTLAGAAARVSTLGMDVTEVVERLGLGEAGKAAPMTVAYHSACSLQHGQGLRSGPQALLRTAGFSVVEPREAHLCCGSAGTYSILQPRIAEQLKARKCEALAATGADVICAGNIGCLTQIGEAAGRPIVHTVELLDWATGGPRPAGLAE
jgi:glycolate oxidase iron-sulfur subunit